MATPEFQIQSPQMTLRHGSPGSFRVDTFDRNGSAVDVSSGYTLDLLSAGALAQPNPAAGNIDLSGSVTATFDTTGVTVSWTAAQANTLEPTLPSEQNGFYMAISNDAGTTHSIVAQGVCALDTAGGLNF